MITNLFVFAVVLGVAGAAAAQSAGGLATVPHPPSPSLAQIEAEARRSARGPRDRPGTLSGVERKRLEALRAPHAEDVQEHREFLNLENTEIGRAHV